jgi:hypothetical protein
MQKKSAGMSDFDRARALAACPHHTLLQAPQCVASARQTCTRGAHACTHARRGLLRSWADRRTHPKRGGLRP